MINILCWHNTQGKFFISKIPKNLKIKLIFADLQRCRHIKPGMVVIESGYSGSTVAAFSSEQNLLVIITLNKDNNDAEWVWNSNYDFGGKFFEKV